jgi:PAS domain S-box-containing protein
MQSLIKTDLDSFTLFEMTPDLVCIAGKDGYFKKVNQAVLQKFEYSETELFSQPISSFMHPDDMELTASKRAELLSGKALVNFQNRYITKSGNFIWLQWTSVYIPDKEIVFAIAKDVTEKKLVEIATEEKYLKYKNLATHFKNKIEKDRKYFAVELHEELAQLATAIKLDIESIGENTPDASNPVKEKIKNVTVISRMLIDTIKRIAFSVSPYVLEDLGLSEALQWSCKEFAILNNISCHFEGLFDEADLNHEMKMDFFRVCQESMSNIMHHSDATAVTVSIADKDNRIYLHITDKGKGFDLLQQKQTPGLTIMRELASSIDAELTIQSEKGKGTTVSISIAKQ